MPVMYNPFGGLVARDVWDILEAYYPVLRRGNVPGGATDLLILGPGVRGCLVGIGTDANPCDCTITLDGVARPLGILPPGQTLPVVAAFSTTCVVTFNNGGAGALAWISYRRL